MTLLVGVLVAGCGSEGSTASAPTEVAPASVPANAPRPTTCPAPPAADPLTADGWIGQLATAPQDTSVVLDDGRGGVVSSGAYRPMPLASATKIVHVAAYGRAVTEGRVRPDEPIRMADWDAWYLPADGGAHIAALTRLGIPHDELGVAQDPNRTVTLEQMVGAMIQESDNAATDYLRHRLGDDALVQAAAAGGWTDLDLPTEVGSQLALVRPQDAPPVTAPRSEREPVEWAMAQRYATDPAFRADSLAKLTYAVSDVESFTLESERWALATQAGSAAQVASLWRAVITGSFGPGADVARAALEYAGPRPDGEVRSFKGGSFVGVGTMALAARQPDGTVAVGVVLGRGFSQSADPKAVGLAQLQFLAQNVADPVARSRVLCVAEPA